MASMITKNCCRSIIFAIVVTIGFLIASKFALAIHRPEIEEVHSQAILLDSNTDGAASNSNEDGSLNNAGYFTSMEAEFEWNRFMVPDYYPYSDPNYSIEKDRDSGRRLLDKNGLRGMRNAN